MVEAGLGPLDGVPLALARGQHDDRELGRPRLNRAASGRAGRPDAVVVLFGDFGVGRMKPGATDTSDPDYGGPADRYAKGDVPEVRIPRMMPGYADPSTDRARGNLYKAGGI